MATNPMQRKARNSFILGMVVAALIAALIIALMYMQISNLKKENDKYINSTKTVCVLRQDVKSGQVLDASMFEEINLPILNAPSDAAGIVELGINEILIERSFSDGNGNLIYFRRGEANNPENQDRYYVQLENGTRDIYTRETNGTEIVASSLTTDNNKYYYYTGENKTGNRVVLSARENAVVAAIDLQANTIITTSMLSRSSEFNTDDLRKQEYNVFALPVDLMPGEYVDVRFALPTGEDYIVASKKKVSIPMANGTYLADTIQLNMTEADILNTSCAIYENYQIEGSKLYVSRYTQAGTQKNATVTYVPSTEVLRLIGSDPNIVQKAIVGIAENRARIQHSLSQFGNSENVFQKTTEDYTSALEQRQQYLQSITSTAETSAAQ